MPIPADVRYTIQSLATFLDNWLHGPHEVNQILLREMHAARVVVNHGLLALAQADAVPLTEELQPPAWCPPLHLGHRLRARAEARTAADATPRPRMPHP